MKPVWKVVHLFLAFIAGPAGAPVPAPVDGLTVSGHGPVLAGEQRGSRSALQFASASFDTLSRPAVGASAPGHPVATSPVASFVRARPVPVISHGGMACSARAPANEPLLPSAMPSLVGAVSPASAGAPRTVHVSVVRRLGGATPAELPIASVDSYVETAKADVSEPGNLAMILAGLGLMGLVAARRGIGAGDG